MRARRDALAARLRLARTQRTELRAQLEVQRLRSHEQGALAKALDSDIADIT